MVKEEILGIVFERAFDSCLLWGSTLRDVGKGSRPELMTWSAWDEMFQLVCDLGSLADFCEYVRLRDMDPHAFPFSLRDGSFAGV